MFKNTTFRVVIKLTIMSIRLKLRVFEHLRYIWCFNHLFITLLFSLFASYEKHFSVDGRPKQHNIVAISFGNGVLTSLVSSKVHEIILSSRLMKFQRLLTFYCPNSSLHRNFFDNLGLNWPNGRRHFRLLSEILSRHTGV